MTGICAIYSSLAQSRHSILSLTSMVIRESSRTHVRRNFISTRTYNSLTSTPASSSNRTAPALSQIFNVQPFGGSLFTVSMNIMTQFHRTCDYTSVYYGFVTKSNLLIKIKLICIWLCFTVDNSFYVTFERKKRSSFPLIVGNIQSPSRRKFS